MQIATFIDYLLYSLFCLIIATTVYKAITLYTLWQWVSHQEKGSISSTNLVQRVQQAESWLTLLFVLAQISPFIGLTGTVLRIQDALVGLSGNSGIADIAHPVGAALHSTFLGLACAIPAVAAYGLLRRAAVRVNQHLSERATK